MSPRTAASPTAAAPSVVSRPRRRGLRVPLGVGLLIGLMTSLALWAALIAGALSLAGVLQAPKPAVARETLAAVALRNLNTAVTGQAWE